MKKFSVFLGVFAVTLSSIMGAHAHSSVVKTIPQYQSVIDELPSEVSIQFSEEPLSIQGKKINSISVTNPEGSVISQGRTTIQGETLTVKINSTHAAVGTYSVKYRMASADGHVISGSYRFDLKKSSKVLPIKEVEENHLWGSHFLHLHKEHILQALAVLFLAAGWFVVRRRRQS